VYARHARLSMQGGSAFIVAADLDIFASAVMRGLYCIQAHIGGLVPEVWSAYLSCHAIQGSRAANTNLRRVRHSRRHVSTKAYQVLFGTGRWNCDKTIAGTVSQGSVRVIYKGCISGY
jgi:hypothetical protein